MTKVFKILKVLRYWGLKDVGMGYEQIFDFTDNQRQSVLSTVRKPSKIEQEQKILISAFV